MRKTTLFAAALVGVALLAAGGSAVEPIKSGPQSGEKVPGPFHPLNVTGEFAGEKHCLYCENADKPVAVVFARNVSAPVSTLIKKIDDVTAKYKKAGMGSFVVFLSGSEELGKELKALASKQSIKSTILSIDIPAGPEKYNIAQDADVTVLLYTDFTVQSNFAFRKGELNDKAIAQIVSNIPKILPKN